MIAMLILLVIFAGLVYYQVFTQGIFSCFIMMVWTLVAAVVALNYQNYLAMLMIDKGFAFYPKAVALMIPFMVVLFGLRTLSDELIKGNMKFPDIIDRAGSVVFAVVSSLIITGIISITLQSLPLGTKILGFERIADMTNINEQSKFWPAGDSFTIKSMEMVSANCFAGSMDFAKYHPDYLRNLHMSKFAPAGFEGSSQYAPSGTITVKDIKVRTSALLLAGNARLEKGAGDLIVLTVKMNAMPTENDKVNCKDVDGNTRFALAQFRLFGHKGKEAVECYPATVMSSDGRTGEAMTMSDGKAYTGVPDQVTLVFQWPTSVGSVPPMFLEFKGSCRAEVPAIKTAEENKERSAESEK